MATELEIANQSLLLLGEGLITSGQLAAPDNKASRLVANLLTLSRRSVLRDVIPGCARKYFELITPGVQVIVDHQYTYALPTDSLRVLTVFSGQYAGTQTGLNSKPVITRWRILAGNEIALDQTDASIEYIYDAPTTVFDPLMDEALSHFLAWKMAVPLTESNNKRDEMGEAYAFTKAQIKEADEQEGYRDIFDDAPRLTTLRHGPSYGAW